MDYVVVDTDAFSYLWQKKPEAVPLRAYLNNAVRIPTICRSGGRARVADPADEHRDVRALPSPVGVQLVKDEELQALCRRDQMLALLRAREHQLQHHVVGEQDVGRVRQDALTVLVPFLTRIPLEGHR